MNDVKIFKYELIVQRSLSMANNRTTLRDNEANLGSSKSVSGNNNHATETKRIDWNPLA